MDVKRLQEVVSRVTYKPGWTFEIYEGHWEGPHIAIHTVLPDSTGEGKLTICVHSMIPPQKNTESFLEWLAWRLARIEVHEMREFFKYEGRVIYDPHAELAGEDR
jgi:hypothetical protein